MMQKKFLTTFVTTTMFLILMGGCGSEPKPKPVGTPLGHHPKDPEQYDFTPDPIEWEVDNKEGLRIHTDDEYIYLQFDHTAAGDEIENIQFIIDIDNDHSTGNAHENGADYIVENGYLYRAKNRDLWDWEELGTVDCAVDGLVDTVKLEKEALSYDGGAFSVNAEALNDNWRPVIYSPSGEDENDMHLKTVYTPNE